MIELLDSISCTLSNKEEDEELEEEMEDAEEDFNRLSISRCCEEGEDFLIASVLASGTLTTNLNKNHFTCKEVDKGCLLEVISAGVVEMMSLCESTKTWCGNSLLSRALQQRQIHCHTYQQFVHRGRQKGGGKG